MDATGQARVGNRPAFAMSSTGSPEPLTIDEVSYLTGYVAALERDAEFVPFDAICHAFAQLQGDLTDHGAQVLGDALFAWAGYCETDSLSLRTPGVLSWIDADDPAAGRLARQLLAHVTAYLARLSCNPVPASTPSDDREWSRIRVARRSKWDDRRLSHAEERAARRHDSELDEITTPNRAERRAATFGHASVELATPDRLEPVPPPRRRPVTEPRTARAPSSERHAFAA
ncbi:hypothetical protein [Aeromicrobium choanae]|uniref:hypothetical protein n=1 Tax=Aeromicrobium choanae TaxID=1736691 RepID=UPI0012947C55|nr:hypothetical protein [Aeromicrobium choanae]